MSRAIQLAKRGRYSAHPNPCVGCVLVKDGRIVGEGWHAKAGEPHAEIVALDKAGGDSRGATAYVTLEPCDHHGRTPPCTEAVIAAGVKRVVVGMQDPNPRVDGGGMDGLRKAGIDVVCGLQEQAARTLNPGFIKRMQTGRPRVTLKVAASMDGRTGLASGESQWITGEAARHDVQYLRAASGAVLTGINTVLHDDPSLNVRLEPEEGKREWRQPLRIVLDTKLRIPSDAKVSTMPGALVLTASEDDEKISALRNAGVRVEQVAKQGDMLNLNEVFDFIGKLEINDVLVEAGATLSGMLLQQGLIDRLVIYLAPTLLGDGTRGMFTIEPLASLSEKINLHSVDMRAVGSDWRIIADVGVK
ncbi:MAG: bifunctional diaminohydroxyphosphoribosylaminopyrimidine deaminase/5-amino-6-(5-phosphoribosylamino)uracil reductase RibD [Gammaproteobacteria bacterium]|nr:bifunctional diaminohydroxyphosphoribosylaminopyrimidine deaminase/5-amino-6-(5-phosphoribosylamino)uracil reductase RibD [Gammaproteobacteria bacterium]